MIIAALLLQVASPTPPPTPPVAGQEDIVVLSPSKPSAQTPATIVLEPVAAAIGAFDTDGDGLTTRAEMETGVQRSFEAIDTARTGKLRYLAFADWALRYLGDRNALPSPLDVDKDGDDQITPDELQAQFSRLYSRFDRDGQAGVSRAELLTFRTAPVGANGPTTPRPAESKRERRGRR